MNEKLNMQDLSAILVLKQGVMKEEADNFIREFFLMIEKALEKDKYVKIKGLGVFKLIEVEPRESVNINTKERFEISRYTKISFTPDSALRDGINKPFAHFETVVLNDNTVFDEKNEQEGWIQEETEEEKEEVIGSNSLCEESQGITLNSFSESHATLDWEIEKQRERLRAVKKYRRLFKVKLYVTLIVLVIAFSCGIFYFANRYRMANEQLKEIEIKSEMKRHPEAFLIDSMEKDTRKSGKEEIDTIQSFVSLTPLGGHVEK